MDAEEREKMLAFVSKFQKQQAKAKNPRNKWWQIALSILISTVLIFAAIFVIQFFLTRKYEKDVADIKAHGATTYGKVIGLQHSKGGTSAEIEFFANGRKYIGKQSTIADYQEQEAYQVMYDKRDPFNFYVDFYNMQFDGSIITKQTNGTVTDVHAKGNGYFFIDRNTVSVEYFINGKKYIRQNVIPYAAVDSFSVGDVVSVTYNIQNPKSALAIPKGRVSH